MLCQLLILTYCKLSNFSENLLRIDCTEKSEAARNFFAFVGVFDYLPNYMHRVDGSFVSKGFWITMSEHNRVFSSHPSIFGCL